MFYVHAFNDRLQIMERYKEKEKMKIPKIPKIPKLSDSKTASSSEVKVKEETETAKIKKEDEKPKKVEPVVHKRLEEVKRERSKSTEKKEPAEKMRKVLVAREENKAKLSSSEDDWEPLPVTVSQPVPAKPVKEKPVMKRKLSKEARNDLVKKRKGWRPARGRNSEDDSDVEVDLTPRQCHGMDCVLTARVGSKYCSDQCGLSLASLRIYQTLPERIREWNLTNCSASETNQKELVRIRSQLTTAREKLEEVDRQVEELEQLISRVKNLAPLDKDSDDSSDEEDDDRKGGGTVNCISCGKVSHQNFFIIQSIRKIFQFQDVSSKIAIRHMESCFNKFESQTSYGSLYKTNIEGYEMVCDFYNPQTGGHSGLSDREVLIVCSRNLL